MRNNIKTRFKSFFKNDDERMKEPFIKGEDGSMKNYLVDDLTPGEYNSLNLKQKKHRRTEEAIRGKYGKFAADLGKVYQKSDIYDQAKMQEAFPQWFGYEGLPKD